MYTSITTIILTYNEELHIKRCVENAKLVSKEVIIVDSFSTDRTCEIASNLGARVYQNPWVNHSKQFNWALANCEVTTDWIMRLDADELLLPELISEINTTLPTVPAHIGGFIIKRRVYFMNKWIRYGGFYPHRLLRVWRRGAAQVEDRWMDEHVILEKGETSEFKHDMVDHNLNDLTWWIQKHNNYATREMIDLIDIANKTTSNQNVEASLGGEQFSRKRWIKEKLYSRIPLFIRPFFYFFFRYIFRLGFLDGKPGLIWHFLQGFWYRFLVDAKIYERKIKDKR